MEKKEPQELDLKQIENTIIVRHNEHRFISPELGFVNDFLLLESSLFAIKHPYRIKEGRVGYIKKGTIHISINLIEYELQANTIVLIAPNSIIEMLEVTPDCEMQMMAIHPDFIQMPHKGELFNHLLNGQRNCRLSLNEKESKQIGAFYSLIWSVLQENNFRREVVRNLLLGLIYNIEYILKDKKQTLTGTLTRQDEIFQRFIVLVNTHYRSHRTVSFYADKLCLTPRYLNTLIRQNSHQTVMDWINQAVIMEAKVLLKHSNQLIYQISDELNFPNPSFFCKFFKRMTGITPLEYQKK